MVFCRVNLTRNSPFTAKALRIVRNHLQNGACEPLPFASPEVPLFSSRVKQSLSSLFTHTGGGKFIAAIDQRDYGGLFDRPHY